MSYWMTWTTVSYTHLDVYKRQAFYRLEKKMKARFPKLPICIVVDSLYAGEPFIKRCIDNNWAYIIRFQERSIPSVCLLYTSFRPLVDLYVAQDRALAEAEEERLTPEHKQGLSECRHKEQKNHSQGGDKRCSAPQKSVGCRRKAAAEPERPSPHQKCVGRVVRILARLGNDDARRFSGAERFCRHPDPQKSG